VLEAVYWWPAHEGKEWPAVVVPVTAWDGLGDEPDPWEHLHTLIALDDRYRWKDEPTVSFGEHS
jgi:hypothetical protein